MAYFIGAYWGPRGESSHRCADRMSMFLQALAKEDSALPRWYKKASSRRTPLVMLPNDALALEPFFKANQRDIGGQAIADLGFSFAAWTGNDSPIVASLSATCGAVSPAVRNSVVLSFDPDVVPSKDLLEKVLNAAVATFDPEDAVVSSTELLSKHAPLLAWEAPSVLRYKRGIGLSLE